MAMRAASAISTDTNWEQALSEVLTKTKDGLDGAKVDLALVFINSSFASHYKTILERIRADTAAKLIAGCSGYGVIGQSTEVEERPALSLLALSLPGATLEPFHFTQELVEEANRPGYWHLETDVLPD